MDMDSGDNDCKSDELTLQAKTFDLITLLRLTDIDSKYVMYPEINIT